MATEYSNETKNVVTTSEVKGLKQTVWVSDAGGAPATGMTTVYIKNGNFIIAFNKTGTTHYRWFELEATDNPVIWNYDTTEPA